MSNREKLPKVADVEREALYGYVFGVSGPGMIKTTFRFRSTLRLLYLSRYG